VITKLQDLKLLVFLLTQEEPVSTTDIAKRFFGVSKRYDIIKKDSWLRYWLEKQYKNGIVKKINNCDKTIYTINKDCIKVGRQILIDWATRELLIKDVVGIKTKEFGWVFYELPEGFALKESV